MWNQKRYEEGYRAAKFQFEEYGVSVAVSEYNHLDGARAVDEYEVGFRTFLNEKGIDPEDASTYAA